MTDAASKSALGRFVLEQLSQPVILLDAAGNVVDVNRAAAADPQLEPLARFSRERREPEIVAFIERLQGRGQASLELMPAHSGPETTLQLRGVALDGFFVVTLEPRPKATPRELELRQSRRLETLGLLTARVVHDINNLLTPLLLLSRDLVTDLEEMGQNSSLAQELETTAQRAACLLQSVLSFARPVPSRTELMTLNTAIAGMRPLLDLLTGPDVELVLSLDERPQKVQVDRVQLEQSLLNLVSNSMHAMPNGGQLQVTATHASLQNLGPDSPRTDYAVLVVKDTGLGMTPEVQQRAFEAFFTTRAAVGGTGLGLSSVQHFVKEHRGLIKLDSEAGQGTRIALHLPLAV
jgi:signal transduction histidine kinase